MFNIALALRCVFVLLGTMYSTIINTRGLDLTTLGRVILENMKLFYSFINVCFSLSRVFAQTSTKMASFKIFEATTKLTILHRFS